MTDNSGRLLIGCEFSGVMRMAFRQEGVDAVSCDLLPTEIPGPHIQDDIINHLEEGWLAAIHHPPCTYLANSGARWFKEGSILERRRRAKEREKAVEFVKRLWRANIPTVAVENPIGTLPKFWRMYDQIVQPWQLGSPTVKATCFWIRGFPLLQPLNVVEGREPKVWREPPSNERWKNRSRTPEPMAASIAKQWAPFLKSNGVKRIEGGT